MLNNALKIIRKYHKLNQTDLANALGVSASHISEIESGKNSITLDMLHKYADYFEVPISHLMLFSENIENQESKVPEKVKRFLAKNLLKILQWQIERDEKKTQHKE